MIGLWQKLSKTGQWVTGVASGVATLIAAYFAVAGFTETMDTWVVTEAEAAELQQKQLEVFEEYRQGLYQARQQHEIDSLELDLKRINLEIRYLNNLDDPDEDDQLELEILIEYRSELRKRLKTLRCIQAGNPPEECSV